MIQKIDNPILTERVNDVLYLLCEGYSYREIVDTLFMADSTLKHHIKTIFQTLGVKEKSQAVAYVYKFGMPEVKELKINKG